MTQVLPCTPPEWGWERGGLMARRWTNRRLLAGADSFQMVSHQGRGIGWARRGCGRQQQAEPGT